MIIFQGYTVTGIPFFFYVFFFFGARPDDAQGFLLAFKSGITPRGAQETICKVRIHSAMR